MCRAVLGVYARVLLAFYARTACARHVRRFCKPPRDAEQLLSLAMTPPRAVRARFRPRAEGDRADPAAQLKQTVNFYEARALEALSREAKGGSNERD